MKVDRFLSSHDSQPSNEAIEREELIEDSGENLDNHDQPAPEVKELPLTTPPLQASCEASCVVLNSGEPFELARFDVLKKIDVGDIFTDLQITNPLSTNPSIVKIRLHKDTRSTQNYCFIESHCTVKNDDDKKSDVSLMFIEAAKTIMKESTESFDTRTRPDEETVAKRPISVDLDAQLKCFRRKASVPFRFTDREYFKNFLQVFYVACT